MDSDFPPVLLETTLVNSTSDYSLFATSILENWLVCINWILVRI